MHRQLNFIIKKCYFPDILDKSNIWEHIDGKVYQGWLLAFPVKIILASNIPKDKHSSFSLCPIVRVN
jgi:hypothetical protein